MYIGIDVHKDICVSTTIDFSGNIIERNTFKNTNKELNAFLNNSPKDAKFAMESSTASKPIYHKMKKKGLEVHMAHPTDVFMITKSTKKTDIEDSFHLANLLRMGYLPESYVPDEKWEEIRNLTRYRVALGRKMSKVKNQIHSLLTRNGVEYRDKFTDLFGVAGRKFLKALKLNKMDSFILYSLLEELEHILIVVEETQTVLANYAKKNKDARNIMTIYGIDFYSALTVLGEIGDVNRFSNVKKLDSFSGLIPRVHQSANIEISGRITKRGPRNLRWILVSCAWVTIKKPGKLKTYYERLRKRKKCAQVAIIATAKKLLHIIYAMLKNGTPYKEEDENLTHSKIHKMKRKAKKIPNRDIHNIINRVCNANERLKKKGGYYDSYS